MPSIEKRLLPRYLVWRTCSKVAPRRSSSVARLRSTGGGSDSKRSLIHRRRVGSGMCPNSAAKVPQ